MEKAAAGDRQDGVILDHLGDAYAETNQVARAREVWNKAIELLTEAEDAERLEKVRAKLNEHRGS